MLYNIIVPQQGLTTESVIVAQWLVKVGDIIGEGDLLVNIESEKAVLSLEAPVAGIVSDICKNEGDEAAIGELLCTLEGQSVG